MIKNHWFAVIAFISISIFSLFLNFPANGPSKYMQVKGLIEQNKFKEALTLLQQSSLEEDNYFLDLYLGEIYAGLTKPSKSLHYYSSAYLHVKNSTDMVLKRVILFKLAHTQIWLQQYQQALNTYSQLLMMELPEAEKVTALAGFKKAFEFQYQNAMHQLTTERNKTNFLCSIPKLAAATFCENPNIQRTPTANLADILRVKRYQQIELARHYIAINDGPRAYELIKAYLDDDKTFLFKVMAAQSMAIMGSPKQSLIFYTQAFHLSKSTHEKKTALLGMLKMQLWLDQTKSAELSARQLNNLPLNMTELKMLRQDQSRLIQLNQQLKYAALLKKIRHLIDMNEGIKAFSLIKPYLHQRENRYSSTFIAAQSMSNSEQPQKALLFYQQAYRLSHNNAEKVSSLFRIASMQFWLAQYERASATYQSILHYKLAPQEYQQALSGVVKSLAYANRPRRAVHAIPCDLTFKSPELVVAAAQATLWADWPFLTKRILIKYKSIIDRIPLNSRLGKDLEDLKWQTKLLTGPNVITPSLFISNDSETFNKKRTTANYTHYWNQTMQTSLGPDYLVYRQHNDFKLDATGFYFEQIMRPTQDLILRGQIEPITYKNSTFNQQGQWSPMLWQTSGLYRPNDIVSMQLLALKEVVETFPAFYNNITDTQYAGTLIINPLPCVQLNAALSRLEFSDQNVRPGYFLAASWLIMPNVGLSTTGVIKGASNRYHSSNYFSPDQYKAHNILFKLSRRLGATWHYYLDGGIGRQYITPLPNTETNSSPTYQWGLGINGPVTSSIILNAYFADSRQVSAFIGSPDYHYQYGGVSVSFVG